MGDYSGVLHVEQSFLHTVVDEFRHRVHSEVRCNQLRCSLHLLSFDLLGLADRSRRLALLGDIQKMSVNVASASLNSRPWMMLSRELEEATKIGHRT